MIKKSGLLNTDLRQRTRPNYENAPSRFFLEASFEVTILAEYSMETIPHRHDPLIRPYTPFPLGIRHRRD